MSKEADKSFQNGRLNLRRWSFIALMPRRTLGYVASSSLMMGIIFLLFASGSKDLTNCVENIQAGLET